MTDTSPRAEDMDHKSDSDSVKPVDVAEDSSNASNGTLGDARAGAEVSRPSPDTSDAAAQSPPPPPNGGYGWVCTICAAFINAHTWGLNSSYGVFLAYYLKEDTFHGASSLDYAFVGGLSISAAMLIAPVATTTTRKFGTHITLYIGVLLETASLIGASFASEIWQLFLSQGVCFGLGMGFLFVGSVPIPSQWFTTRRSLANGISACGSGLGGLTYSLATGAMLRTIGLAWAFRVLGIICFVVNTLCASLLRDRNKIIGSSQRAFDLAVLRRPEYLLLGAWGVFSMLGYVVLIFSLADYAESVGLSDSQASLISALFNLGQAFGRPPIGYFSDTVGRINMAAAMTFLSGLFALLIWDFANSFGVLVFYALIGGTVAGTFWATISPVTAEVIGLRNVPSGLNLMWLIIVLPTAFSEPIALEIVSGTGSYRGTILFTGFMYFAASFCLLLLRGWRVGELEYLASLQNGLGGDEKRAAVLDNDNADARKAGRKTFWRYCWRLKKV